MRSLTTSALTAAALILTALPAVAGNWYGLISAGLVHSDNNYKEAVGAVNVDYDTVTVGLKMNF